MKKFISVILLIAVLLSCCGCGAKQAAEPTKATLDPASPEAMFGHIDQNTPIDGVYKIWNAEGVKTMADHPDGSFEILCNIDMKGATLSAQAISPLQAPSMVRSSPFLTSPCRAGKRLILA